MKANFNELVKQFNSWLVTEVNVPTEEIDTFYYFLAQKNIEAYEKLESIFDDTKHFADQNRNFVKIKSLMRDIFIYCENGAVKDFLFAEMLVRFFHEPRPTAEDNDIPTEELKREEPMTQIRKFRIATENEFLSFLNDDLDAIDCKQLAYLGGTCRFQTTSGLMIDIEELAELVSDAQYQLLLNEFEYFEFDPHTILDYWKERCDGDTEDAMYEAEVCISDYMGNDQYSFEQVDNTVIFSWIDDMGKLQTERRDF